MSAIIACTVTLVASVTLGLASTSAVAATPNGLDRTTLNHAGYAVDLPKAKQVTAQWVQPEVTCGAETTYSNLLVGLSRGGSLVARVGTSADCRHGRAVNYAWAQFADGTRARFPQPVNPGDHLTARVTNHGGDVTAGISDETRGWAFGLGWITHIATSRAVVLVQARSGSDGVLPLTPSHVVFSHCTVDDNLFSDLHPKRFVLSNEHNDATPGDFSRRGRFDIISS